MIHWKDIELYQETEEIWKSKTCDKKAGECDSGTRPQENMDSSPMAQPNLKMSGPLSLSSNVKLLTETICQE